MLVASAVLRRNYQGFEVVIGESRFDGFDIPCKLTLTSRTPKSLAGTADFVRTAIEWAPDLLDATALDKIVGTIVLAWHESGGRVLPRFEVHGLIAPDSLDRVQRLVNRGMHIHILLTTSRSLRAGLVSGMHSDRDELQWDASSSVVTLIDSAQLRFSLSPPADLDDDP